MQYKFTAFSVFSFLSKFSCYFFVYYSQWQPFRHAYARIYFLFKIPSLYVFSFYISLFAQKARHVTGVLSWFYMISVAYLIIFSSYSLVPRPIFSAWSRVAFHSIFGLESLKWSWWQCHPGSAKCSPSWLLAIGVAFRQASAQAWSSATGSKLANIPISGRIGASFSPWQSQLGLISCTCLLYTSRCV